MRYINNIVGYEDVSILLTDGYGHCPTVGLIPNEDYAVRIEATDYQTAIYDLHPVTIDYTEDRYHVFMLEYGEIEYDNETSYAECLTFTGEYSGNTGYVNFTWGGIYCGTISNFSIWVYEINTTSNVTSYLYSYNDTAHSAAITFNIDNLSNNFYVKLFLNSTVFGNHWNTLYVTLSPKERGYSYTSISEFEDFFEEIFGSNSLGWGATFGIFVLLACLFSFGQQGAGIGLILCGFVMLGLNAAFGLVLIGVTISVVIVVFGILVQWGIEVRSQ